MTDEQYRSIVGDRLEGDDFIEDDDGSGYVDHGEDEWGGHESSEDEDDFEGEDEELRKGELAESEAQLTGSAQGEASACACEGGEDWHQRPVQGEASGEPE